MRRHQIPLLTLVFFLIFSEESLAQRTGIIDNPEPTLTNPLCFSAPQQGGDFLAPLSPGYPRIFRRVLLTDGKIRLLKKR